MVSMLYHLGVAIGSIFVPPIGRRLVTSYLVSIGVPQGDQFLRNDDRVLLRRKNIPFMLPIKTATEGGADAKFNRGINHGR